MKKIRQLLTASLGLPAYLRLVSYSYIQLVRLGLMRKAYPELYYLKHLVNPGDVVIDIGANVGYYSVMLSQRCGLSGKVYSVEPVPLFAGIFSSNMQRFALPNYELLPFALGSSEQEITMTTPVVNGVFRHGLTHIASADEATNAYQYKVKMKIPDQLFSNLSRLDFVKCDVEGYEAILLPSFIKTISKFKPTLQIEIGTSENRDAILELLQPIGYKIYQLHENSLVEGFQHQTADYYFKA